MTTLKTIDQRFQDYNLPNLNWVRLPEIKISKEDKIKLGLNENSSNFEFLKARTFYGLEERKKNGQVILEKEQEYIDRINEELDLINDLGFCDYYLLVYKTIEYASQFTNYLDPARGSCGGSSVFYHIGVTQVDPVRHSLFLSRFISKARANKKEINGVTYIQGDLAPDVDINFAQDIRDKIIHWLEKEYGGKLAKISTFTTLTTRIVLKEAYKSMVDGSTEEESKKITDHVQSIFGKLEDINSVYENNESFRKWADENPDIVDVSKKLINLPKTIGSHASGYVISFDPLEKISAVTLNRENELSCVYDMDDISKLSLKLDLLGLTTNQIVDDCLNSINKKYADINLFDDASIYNHFNNPYLGTGLYQIEKGCAYNVTRAIKPRNIDELSDVNALARPGALSYVKDYVDNTGDCPHDVFKPILTATRNQPLYQEQMIQMAMALGFDPSEGEQIRRCVTGDTTFISKKLGRVSIKYLMDHHDYRNDEFLIVDRNNNQYWKPIQDIWASGFKKTKKIITMSHEIETSEDHEILTLSGWKQSKDIDFHDKIACVSINKYDKSTLYYESIESFIFQASEKPVYDFTIDDETPYIVGNNIIIHNCVAKKKRDQIKEWEPKVYAMCEKKGIPKEAGDYFWKLLEESADYSFNKCLSPDTLVETMAGKKKMSQISIGDKILAYNVFHKTNHFVKVDLIYSNEAVLYEIELYNGFKIHASLNHKFLSNKDEMVPLGDFNVGLDMMTIGPSNYEIVKSIRKIGLQKTLDFKVDHPDHNFYANGIVVSNSHSVGVSYVGALTTYLKYNHPIEFYTAFLNNCKDMPDPSEKTSSAIRELKHFGIKILAPNLLKSKDEFTIENGGIRYGLQYIKGISDSSLANLAKFRQTYDNKFEVFKAVDDLKIKLNVICPLIQAGALENNNDASSRTYCVYEAQVWKNLTAKEKNTMLEIGGEFNYDLIECLRHLINSGKIKDSRAATLRKNTAKYHKIFTNNQKYNEIVDWYYEYKLLGFSYSYELVDVFKGYLKKNKIPEIYPFIALNELVSNHQKYQNETIRIVGITTESIVAESKKTGNRYLKVTIEDGKNSFTAFMMDKDSKIYEMIRVQDRTPEKGDLIVCAGKLSKPKDEDAIPVLFADEIDIQKNVHVFMKLHDLKTYQKSNNLDEL